MKEEKSHLRQSLNLKESFFFSLAPLHPPPQVISHKKGALPPSPYHPQKSNPPSSYSSSFLHHLLSPSSFDTAAAVIPPFKAVSPISLSASTLIRRRGRPRASEGYFPRGPKRIKEGKACNDVLHLPTHFFGTILLNRHHYVGMAIQMRYVLLYLGRGSGRLAKKVFAIPSQKMFRETERGQGIATS